VVVLPGGRGLRFGESARDPVRTVRRTRNLLRDGVRPVAASRLTRLHRHGGDVQRWAVAGHPSSSSNNLKRFLANFRDFRTREARTEKSLTILLLLLLLLLLFCGIIMYKCGLTLEGDRIVRTDAGRLFHACEVWRHQKASTASINFTESNFFHGRTHVASSSMRSQPMADNYALATDKRTI